MIGFGLVGKKSKGRVQAVPYMGFKNEGLKFHNFNAQCLKNKLVLNTCCKRSAVTKISKKDERCK